MPRIQEPVLALRVDEFLTYCEARNLRPNTIRTYRTALAGLIDPLDDETTVDAVTRKGVRRFVAKLHEAGASPATSKLKLAAVKSFCKWMALEDLLPATFDIRGVNGPKLPDKLPDIPSESDMRRLLDGPIPTNSPERDRVILELLYGCGLRVEELCGINIDDFRGDDVLLIRGKGNKEREVIFGEFANLAIREWLPVRIKLMVNHRLETDALLFSLSQHRSVEHLNVRSVRRILAQVCRAKRLPEYHPHLLRHAYASHLHDRNAPLQAISTLMGHANLSMTARYARVSVGRMKETYNRAHPHAVAQI
jgi:integrase/recombinase XerC